MMTISVITPTFRREDLLARCVESILNQQTEGVHIEHIVVNDAGEPLTRAIWMDDPRVQVLNTFRTERSVARNTGAALARGEWLYFLDDDDYTLPGAFAAMQAVALTAPAVHVYGGYRVANETLQTIHDVQPVVPDDPFPLMFSAEIIPLQASWIRRDAFFHTGGFDPRFKAAEDNDLFRRLSFFGTSAGTQTVVSVIRAEHRTTTSHWSRQKEFTHLGIDKCLEMPGVTKRLYTSTRRLPYWRGRCVRVFASSATYHLRHGRFLSATSRVLVAARLAAPMFLHPAFYKGLR